MTSTYIFKSSTLGLDLGSRTYFSAGANAFTLKRLDISFVPETVTTATLYFNIFVVSTSLSTAGLSGPLSPEPLNDGASVATTAAYFEGRGHGDVTDVWSWTPSPGNTTHSVDFVDVGGWSVSAGNYLQFIFRTTNYGDKFSYVLYIEE